MSKLKQQKTLPLMVASLGVVYGDIGTSPLYALKSVFEMTGMVASSANIMGLISLFAWTLFVVVTLKYVLLVMRNNNRGEGGVLVLSAMCGKIAGFGKISLILGVIGSALFFGDAIITPAISVLGALEGLEIIVPKVNNIITLIAVLLIIGLFYLQSYGSGKLGKYFGIVMIVWFSTLIAMGVACILNAPKILMSINPFYAVKFLLEHGHLSLMIISGTILVVTGAEALYADMGHFGHKPITLSWMIIVFPALLINYMGQGAVVLNNPAAISNPFYMMVPEKFIFPLTILSTISTIIASQAVISGLFSIGWQWIMLNYIPRMRVSHTSKQQIGQVYMPAINFILAILTISAVVIFKESQYLASAYGLSVAGVMVITTVFICALAIKRWRWKWYKLLLVFIPLFCLDITFFLTNIVKIASGAWYTFSITLLVTYLIYIWMLGSRAAREETVKIDDTLANYIQEYAKSYRQKIPGCAVFMSRHPNKVPSTLILHLKHNKYLYEKMVFVTIVTSNMPRVLNKNKFKITNITNNVWTIIAEFGFSEVPDLNKVLKWAQDRGSLELTDDFTVFFSRGFPVASDRKILSGLAEQIYIFLAKNSLPAYEFYKVPYQDVVELGARYKI